MTKIYYLLAVTVALCLAFAAGRYTSPEPRFEPGSLAGDDALEQAWENFLHSQRASLALLRNSPFYGDDLERAEAYQNILYNLVLAIRTTGLMNPDFPKFVRVGDWSSKSGLDNPDDYYYLARIRGDVSYRIRGTRGTAVGMEFQLLYGEPGIGEMGSGAAMNILHDRDIEKAADGSYEILVSPEDPGPGKNWLRSGADAGMLLARFTVSDWGVERSGRLQIERLGSEGQPEVPMAPNRMAAALQEVAISLYARTVGALEYSRRAWRLSPRNGVSAVRPAGDGREGQYYALGSWELNNSQALVISTAPSAPYQGIALGNLWTASLDYETRTGSLSLDQTGCSPDGRCYVVVSHRDPGVRNWLDTGGHRRGLIMMRWQGLEDLPDPMAQPQATLVDFDALWSHLPDDVERVTESQRMEQRRRRRANLQMRF